MLIRLSLLAVLFFVAGCTNERRVAGSSGGYLEACDDDKQCAIPLTCSFNLCTRPCGEQCQGRTQCVAAIDRCIPLDLVPSVLDSGVIADASTDATHVEQDAAQEAATELDAAAD